MKNKIKLSLTFTFSFLFFGTARAVENKKCGSLVKCEATSIAVYSCPAGKGKPETSSCVFVDSCRKEVSGPVCMTLAEACKFECGKKECLVAESSPAQVSCKK